MKSAANVLDDVLRGAMAAREHLTVSQWADKYRQITVGARKGQWSTEVTPYLRAVMDACCDPFVREITLMSARQMGKTEAVYNALFWLIDADPRDVLFVYPTKELAAFNNKRRFLPTLKRTARARRWLGASNRDAGALELNFRRMMLRFVGSNSEANLESYPYPVVIVDELDRCDPDTLPQVRESLKTFPEFKLIKVSTPSVVGVGIDAEFNGTQVSFDEEDGGAFVGTPPADRRRFAVPCPRCGCFHLRTFSQVRWVGGRAATKAAAKASAYMECPACKGRIEAADNAWQLARGVWAPVPKGAGAGGGGAGAVIRTAERERLADFSAPYFQERVMVYARRPLPDAGLDQLRGLRVGVIRGWSYGDPFDQARQLREFQVEEVERDVQNFEKLRLGRVDAVLATEPAGELLLRLPRFRGLQAMPRPLWVFGIHLAFARSPSRRELLQAFDREIAAMQQSGEWAQLVQRESEAARGELEAELKRLPVEAKSAP